MNVRYDARAHGRRTLAALAGGGIWVVAALFLWRTEVPELDLPRLDPRDYFSRIELERGDRFRAVTRALWAGSVVVELAVLGLLAWKGGRLATAFRARTGGRVRTAVAVGLLVIVAARIATLPLDAVRHWWDRRYGLSEQGYGAWLGDVAVGLGLRAVLVSLAVAGAVALAARLGPRWWMAGAPALVATAVVYVLVQPLVVQPLFNRFEPVPDGGLATDVRRLGERLGVEVDTVEVADASRRTTRPNAYVAGIGPTRRVVFYDTILDGRFSEAELRSVAAHELAHVGRHHLWKGLGWFALLAAPGVLVVALVTERRGGLADPGLVPLGLLVALLLYLGTLPVQNAASRRYEAEADWLALTATGDADAAVDLERRLVTSSVGDPTPPVWARLVLSTHPPALERIAMAEAFRARRTMSP